MDAKQVFHLPCENAQYSTASVKVVARESGNFLLHFALVFIEKELKTMRVLFRALLLLMALVFVLGLIKWLFIKMLFFGFWVAGIAFVVFVIYSILKPSTS
jgi:hypothetical protein